MFSSRFDSAQRDNYNRVSALSTDTAQRDNCNRVSTLSTGTAQRDNLYQCFN